MTQNRIASLPTVLSPSGLIEIMLRSGSHYAREQAVCAMEAVAWLAGEPHSAHPQCACPVLGAFMRTWSDLILTDERRNALLKPLLPLLVGSRSTADVELTRSYLAFDWLVRVQTPAWLDLTPALTVHAAALRALAPLADKSSVQAADGPLAAAGDAAWAAAGDAVWEREDAAWAATGDAAWAAARKCAIADGVVTATGDAAWTAARDAVWAAAWDAERAALSPTVEQLELSAIDLVKRMVVITG